MKTDIWIQFQVIFMTTDRASARLLGTTHKIKREKKKISGHSVRVLTGQTKPPFTISVDKKKKKNKLKKNSQPAIDWMIYIYEMLQFHSGWRFNAI